MLLTVLGANLAKLYISLIKTAAHLTGQNMLYGESNYLGQLNMSYYCMLVIQEDIHLL